MFILESQILVQFVADYFYWVFLGLILLNLMQRKHGAKAQRKRMAAAYLSLGALIIHTSGSVSLAYGGADIHVIIAIGVVVMTVYYFRAHAFPFSLRCRVSNKVLDLDTILYRDSNTLPQYDETEHSQQSEGSKPDRQMQGVNEGEGDQDREVPERDF